MKRNKDRVERSRVVHGWAFTNHTPTEVDAIREYITTGQMSPNFPEMYRKGAEWRQQ